MRDDELSRIFKARIRHWEWDAKPAIMDQSILDPKAIEQAMKNLETVQITISSIVCTEGPFTLDLAQSTEHLSVWHCKACGGTVHIGPDLIVDIHAWAHMKPKEVR